MTVYIVRNRYYFKKMIEGRVYYKALRLRRGQEAFLSGRAKQVEEEILARHFNLPPISQKQIGLVEYCHRYLERNHNKKSWDRERQRLEKIIKIWGDGSLHEIGRGQIEKLEKALFSWGLKPSTVNRYFELLRHLFNQALEDGYITDNPARSYHPFVEDPSRRALSNEEITAVLTAAMDIQAKAKTSIQRVIYDLILFGLMTGLRLSEILNLRRSWIRDDVIYFPISQTKSRRRTIARAAPSFRITTLNRSALDIIGRQRSRADFVFPVSWRNPNAIFYAVREIRKFSRVEDFHFHQLRHTVSTIVSASSGLATAKAVLGHADLKTTLKYTHPALAEQRQTVEKLDQTLRPLIPVSRTS
jgi:integrase